MSGLGRSRRGQRSSGDLPAPAGLEMAPMKRAHGSLAPTCAVRNCMNDVTNIKYPADCVEACTLWGSRPRAGVVCQPCYREGQVKYLTQKNMLWCAHPECQTAGRKQREKAYAFNYKWLKCNAPGDYSPVPAHCRPAATCASLLLLNKKYPYVCKSCHNRAHRSSSGGKRPKPSASSEKHTRTTRTTRFRYMWSNVTGSCFYQRIK